MTNNFEKTFPSSIQNQCKSMFVQNKKELNNQCSDILQSVNSAVAKEIKSVQEISNLSTQLKQLQADTFTKSCKEVSNKQTKGLIKKAVNLLKKA